MKPLPIALLLAALALAALGLATLLSSDPVGPAQSSSLRRDSAGELAPPENDGSAAAGAPLAIPDASRSGDPRRLASAPAMGTGDGQPRWIVGRVLSPGSAPADPALTVTVLGQPCQYKEFARAQDHPGNDPDEFPMDRDLRLAVAGAVLAQAPVQGDGSFRVQVPPRLSRAFLMARGRFLFLGQTVAVELRGEETEVVLAPQLGCFVRGQISSPGGGAPRGAIARLFSASAGGPMGSMGRPESFSGLVAAGTDGGFEVRAVPAGEPYTLAVTAEDTPGWRGEVGTFDPGRTVELAVALKAGGNLRGVVVDGGGRPVAGAEVRAWLPGRFFGLDDVPARTTTSDEAGRFLLAAVPAGRVKVSADHRDHLDSVKATALVPEGGEAAGLDLVLEDGRSIAGTVTHADGRPAPGVEVRAWFDITSIAGPNFMNMTRGAQARTVSDGSGSFVLRGLGVGPFVVEASHEPDEPEEQAQPGSVAGLAQVVVPLRARAEGVRPGTEGLGLVLRLPLGVIGQVVDDEDAPVTSFAVVARRESQGEFFAVTTAYRRADFESAGGDFLLEGLDEGSWVLEVEGDGLISDGPVEVAVPQALSEAGAAPTLVLRALRAVTVTGVVRDTEGEPVSGAAVRLDAGASLGWQMELDPFPSGARTSALEDGTFTLGGLRPGALALVASAEGFADSPPLPLTTEPGELVEEVLLTLSAGGALAGEVYDSEGKLGAGWMVLAFNGADFSQSVSMADSRGEFLMEHLVPGLWMVFAMDPERELEVGEEGVDMAAMMGSFRMAQATLIEGETTRVTIGAPPEAPVTVYGKVTLGDEPYPGVAISFVREGGRLYQDMVTTNVDEEGRYQAVLDGPGSYLVSIQALMSGAGQQSSIEFAVEVPELDEQRLDFELPLGRISGRVLDSAGGSASGARVTLTPDGAVRSDAFFGGQYTEITSGADGGFDVKGLRPGTYRLSVGGASPWSGSLQTPYGRVTTGDLVLSKDQWLRDLELRLPRPGTIEVKVVDSAGRPLSQATVFVRDEGGRMLEPFSMILSDGTGRCQYTGVAPGEFTVSARLGLLTCQESDPVRVPRGGTGHVTLRLEEGTVLLIRLKDAAGDPTAASVSVLDADGREMGGTLGMQDLQTLYLEGTFSTTEHRLGPLPPGKYKLSAVNDGGSATKSVRLRGEPEKKVTLRLR